MDEGNGKETIADEGWKEGHYEGCRCGWMDETGSRNKREKKEIILKVLKFSEYKTTRNEIGKYPEMKRRVN